MLTSFNNINIFMTFQLIVVSLINDFNLTVGSNTAVFFYFSSTSIDFIQQYMYVVPWLIKRINVIKFIFEDICGMVLHDHQSSVPCLFPYRQFLNRRFPYRQLPYKQFPYPDSSIPNIELGWGDSQQGNSGWGNVVREALVGELDGRPSIIFS